MPKALLIYPEFPPSYWSEKYALEFIGRKAAFPPLGLLTVAALFPPRYELKVIDMNVEPLTDEHLAWADYAFLSAMIVQKNSFHEVAQRCKARGLPVIAGGPYPTSYADTITDVDYLVRGEVEDFFSGFLDELERGIAPAVSEAPRDAKGLPSRPNITHAPIPRYDLIDLKQYGAMALQFSRGCPFDCEFCDITALFGRLPRTKSNEQVIAEMQYLYGCGWRGSVFFVDDNFIGNKARARALMPAITAWQKEHGRPFFFYTEASVNLASMPDLMDGMTGAGFDMVFLGLETPNPKLLLDIGKGQNVKQDNPDFLLNAVRTIQQHGIEVTAGFIIGLDGDDEAGFQAQVDFVQKAGIPTAMVGLLNALKGTKLYDRYRREGRLLQESTGNNLAMSLSYVPTIDAGRLIASYRKVLASLYDRTLSNYFERCYVLLSNWERRTLSGRGASLTDLIAFARTLWRILLSVQGPAYAKLLAKVIINRPQLLPEAVRLAIMGYHYEKVTRQQMLVDELRSYLDQQYARFQEMFSYLASAGSEHLHEARLGLEECYATAAVRYRAINHDFRHTLDGYIASFQQSTNALIEKYAPAWDFSFPSLVQEEL